MGQILNLRCFEANEAFRLVAFGIVSTDRLLLVAAHKQGREDIAEATDLPEDRILRAVHCADLMRVNGIGTEYVGLLDAVGVRTLKQLARRSVDRLYADMEEQNRAQPVVRRLPSPDDVAAWVSDAEALESVISY
jgi:predicted flap endonuclease-1-like 5' DNA nuclease